MQRKTRLLRRAAKYLEQEAAEYISAGKADAENSNWFGRKAQIYLGTAFSVRTIASTGYAPTRKLEDDIRLKRYMELTTAR